MIRLQIFLFFATSLALIFFSEDTFTQTVPYDPLYPPTTYRNTDNPNYWKNKKPYEGYWQQDVHYEIKANIDELKDIIEGAMVLTYWNNSPDTLTHLFFHLYQNAFQPGSYYDNLKINNLSSPRYGMYEMAKLGTVIEHIEIDGVEVSTELDNTILKVNLTNPLPPEGSLEVRINFTTYYDINGSSRRRMKSYYVRSFAIDSSDVNSSDGILTYHKHFDGVLWYPRVSVYDRKFGWTTDQHLDKEFYGDFGSYDVSLTFSDNYVVGATGFLLNEEEMLPGDLRQKLDISNFANKPFGEIANDVVPYDSEKRKTWVFHAENVHDFAFTADPTYRIGEMAYWPLSGRITSYSEKETNESGRKIKCMALAREANASKWQNAAEYAAKVIKLFSEDFGEYTYHKIIVADARDGMEYPMLTLDGGKDPSYRGLFIHEIGHNWFYGQLGNNETYRAALDEGFTQFITSWGMERLEGLYFPTSPIRNKYVKRFKQPQLHRFKKVYSPYLSDAITESDPALNTHSSDFNSGLRHGGGYRHVYYKTATMLYNLQYVLGDDLFQKAMQYYVEQWKICHPYFSDFRNAIIQYTKTDLNWFFDQWLETNKNIDYGVRSIKKGGGTDEYYIKFVRKGKMQMPIDFQVISKSGETYDYYIPNTWFVKKTNATTLPKWYGWGKLQPTYIAKVIIPGGIKNVIIDPSGRLADVNRLDNAKRLPVTLTFDSQIYNDRDWSNYKLKWRPDVWFNGYDGIKAGLHLNGNYVDHHHVFKTTIWYNTGSVQGGFHNYEYPGAQGAFDPFSISVYYRTSIDKFIKDANIVLIGKSLDGANILKGGISKYIRPKNRIYIFFKSLHRPNGFSLNYDLYPDEWEVWKLNNTINIGLVHSYRYLLGNGTIHFSMRSNAILSDYDYSNMNLSVINTTRIWKFDLRTRFFTQYGTGRDVPGESALFLAGRNPEELLDNKYTRAKGFFPTDWVDYGVTTNHFHHGGGMNLRGYAGYRVAEQNDGVLYTDIYKGNSGVSINGELDFDRLFRFQPKFLRRAFHLDTYLFGDAGSIVYNRINGGESFATVRMDAGVGTALTIKRFWVFQTIKPLTIRFDMPLILSHTPYVDPDFFQFRWIIGVNRAF